MTQYIPILTPEQTEFWNKNKENILKQAQITYGNEIHKILELKQPYSDPCGCLGPRKDDLFCPCQKQWVLYTYRLLINIELSPGIYFQKYSTGSICKFKYKEDSPLTLECFILDFNFYTGLYTIGYIGDEGYLSKREIEHSLISE